MEPEPVEPSPKPTDLRARVNAGGSITLSPKRPTQGEATLVVYVYVADTGSDDSSPLLVDERTG